MTQSTVKGRASQHPGRSMNANARGFVSTLLNFLKTNETCLSMPPCQTLRPRQLGIMIAHTLMRLSDFNFDAQFGC